MAQDNDAGVAGEDLMNGTPSSQCLPPIAASFLVKFDHRKGYVLAWQRSIDSLHIDGVVEFKSLPSGLHNVHEDLVYFVHDEYAGVSAFLNTQDTQAERNARMLAVGVLVPLDNGRMGKSWLHAGNLKELCREQAEQADNYTLLEKYWDEHKLKAGTNQDAGHPTSKSKTIKTSQGYQKARSMSVGTIPPASNHTLSDHHPAFSLSRLLTLFGPLILPLYRAALLRKRILFLSEAPVEQACNFVYDLSIISSIPRPVAEDMALESPADLRLKPLFNIGITDIPILSAWKSTHGSDLPGSHSSGWVASTTDDVLCTKPDLFDLLVRLPSTVTPQDTPKQYPKLIISSPELTNAYPKQGLRASQRDAKRYKSLAVSVRSFAPSVSVGAAETVVVDDALSGNADTASIASSISSGISNNSVVEPQSWGRIAYTSLVWWASAGDKRSGLTDGVENEDEQDLALLAPDYVAGGVDEDDDEGDDEQKTQEVAIVSFFHRLTVLIFDVLSAAVGRSEVHEGDRYRDDDDSLAESTGSRDLNTDETSRRLLQSRNRDSSNNQNDDSPPVEITADDMAQMGLDIWSEADRKFIEEMISFWWGRETVVHGGKVECCGIQIM